MRHRYLVSSGRFAVAAAVVALALVPAAGQAPASGQGARQPRGDAGSWKAPRTAFGQPDLQGVWANNSATPLERPKLLAGRATLTEQEMRRIQQRAQALFDGAGDAAFGDEIFEAALSDREKYVADSFDKATGNYNSFWLVGRYFDNRTSLITDPPDGRVPEMTPEGAKRAEVALAQTVGGTVFDSHEDRPLPERCLTFGFPDLLAGYNSYYQIAQTPEWVAIYTERIHDTRLIPLDGRPPLSKNIRFWHGDSRGRWEGDTLVVETTNFSGKMSFRGSSDQLRVTERFTRVAPDTLHYQVTVNDPTTWKRPWTLMIPLKHSTEKIYEYACHEGNTGLMGVLTGARAQDRGK
jgi:hypothetical protein